MEFEEAHNNLRAIRLLYRLLKDNTITLQNSNDLVERARALLKTLLDVAVQSVFETHLKTVDAQAGISKTSFEQEKHDVVQESKSPVSANVSQSSVKYPPCSKMTPEKEEKPQLKLLSKKELSELSKFSISDDGERNCKTLCSIGEGSSMMKQNIVQATNLSNGNSVFPNTESNHNKQQHNGVDALYGDGERAKESLHMFDVKDSEQNEENDISLLNGVHEAQSNSIAARQIEYPDQMGDFSGDLVNAIKRIESRILAFKLCSNFVDSSKSSAGKPSSGSPVIQRINGASGSQSSCGKSLLEGHRLMSQKTCKPSSKGENLVSANAFEEPFFAGNESLSQSKTASQNHCLHTSAESAKIIDVPKRIGTQMVSGGECLGSQNRIQSSEQSKITIDRAKSLNRLVSADAYFGSQASECIQGFRLPLNQDNHTKKHSMSVSKTNRKSVVRKNPVAWSKTNQNRKEMRSESSYAQKLAGSKSIIARREKPPAHQMVMKPTLLDQRSSEIKVNSNQQRQSSVLDNRRTPMTGHLEPQKTRVLPQHHEPEESSSKADSSRWSSQQGSVSDSEDYSLPDGTQCSPLGRIMDAAYEGSSEESNNSYLYKDDVPSHRFGGFKSNRHHRERNSKETIGKLSRLKNKLGIIFHHHHHYHHHHHLDDDHGNTHSRAGHRHGIWNHLQNVFHHKDKHGVLTEKVEKTRTALSQKNQIGKFHRLAEGFLRHIQHSKKPKPSKLDGVKHGPTQKKLFWWQILRRHKGVKLKNKGRLKVRIKNSNSLKNY